MSHSVIEGLARQLRDFLAREPASINDLNLLLSPIAHVLLGPDPGASDRHIAPNVVAQQVLDPVTGANSNPTRSESMSSAASGQKNEKGGPRRSSRATKGTKKSWSQDVEGQNAHPSSTMSSLNTTAVTSPQTHASSSRPLLPRPEVSRLSGHRSNDREGAASTPGEAEHKNSSCQHREANRVDIVGQGGYPTAGHGHPTAEHGHPTAGHGHPTAGHGHPTVGHGYPTVGPGGYPTAGHGHPTAGHGHPTVGHGYPIVGQGGYPTAGHGHPTAGHGHPTVGHGYPTVGPGGYPTAGNGHPTVGHGYPTVGPGGYPTIHSNESAAVSAYPVSLASRWSPGRTESTVRASGLNMRKRPRVEAVDLQPHSVPDATDRGHGNTARGGPASHKTALPPESRTEEQKEELTIVARDKFRSRWAPVFPDFTDWARLDCYEKAGKRVDQAPYEELDKLMVRLCKIGTPSVQTAFTYAVTKWLASPYASGRRIETPEHLLNIPGFDPAPFQKFWFAEEMARCSKGVEDMSIILRRKALSDFLSAYHEVIAQVRHNAAHGRVQLAHGYRAAAEARRILYEIIYPDLESRDRARSFFNSSQTRGNPYYQIQKRYGSIGILAMIPTRMGENEFRASDSLFHVFLELLNIFRPELRDATRLDVFGRVIDIISGGGSPDVDLMQELTSLTSS